MKDFTVPVACLCAIIATASGVVPIEAGSLGDVRVVLFGNAWKVSLGARKAFAKNYHFGRLVL